MPIQKIGDLTRQQYRVLRYLFEEVRRRGRPPTVREICGRFGFRSTGGARRHLEALEKKGYLSRPRTGAHRGLDLVWPKVWKLFGIPIVGRVPAGKPRLADAEFLGSLTPEDFYPEGEGLFALKVEGESMTGAGLLPGDVVIVREQPTAEPGEIVVALIEDEATVKRLAQRAGKLYLEPANPKYPAVELDGGRILGKVIKVLRDLG
jgi:repressor LexA